MDVRLLGVSFWRLGRDRREELVWRPVANALGSISYRIYDNGSRADIYASLLRYSYEVVTRSLLYVLKNFRFPVPPVKTYGGRYTVVDITITPPILEGVRIHIQDPLTSIRTYDSCTTISVVSRSYDVYHVRDACLTPFRLKQKIPELPRYTANFCHPP